MDYVVTVLVIQDLDQIKIQANNIRVPRNLEYN